MSASISTNFLKSLRGRMEQQLTYKETESYKKCLCGVLGYFINDEEI